MTTLDSILAHTRDEVAMKKRLVPRQHFEDAPFFHRRPLSLARALRGERMAVIAEVKKGSPSKNLIREDFRPVEIAASYVRGGAKAVSVLTDRQFFLGDLAHLEAIRSTIDLPLLRKDFIIDSYQLYESKASGADAVLLIAAALEPHSLSDLKREGEELGLECLLEVHSLEEINSLEGEKVEMVGINNRDLKTFCTDLEVSLRLREFIAPDVLVVSESGIRTADDLARLMAHGIHAALIGETLMSAADPGETLARLLAEVTPAG
jgi:indole-3-glycerol phosphate synthase